MKQSQNNGKKILRQIIFSLLGLFLLGLFVVSCGGKHKDTRELASKEDIGKAVEDMHDAVKQAKKQPNKVIPPVDSSGEENVISSYDSLGKTDTSDTMTPSKTAADTTARDSVGASHDTSVSMVVDSAALEEQNKRRQMINAELDAINRDQIAIVERTIEYLHGMHSAAQLRIQAENYHKRADELRTKAEQYDDIRRQALLDEADVIDDIANKMAATRGVRRKMSALILELDKSLNKK